MKDLLRVIFETIMMAFARPVETGMFSYCM